MNIKLTPAAREFIQNKGAEDVTIDLKVLGGG